MSFTRAFQNDLDSTFCMVGVGFRGGDVTERWTLTLKVGLHSFETP